MQPFEHELDTFDKAAFVSLCEFESDKLQREGVKKIARGRLQEKLQQRLDEGYEGRDLQVSNSGNGKYEFKNRINPNDYDPTLAWPFHILRKDGVILLKDIVYLSHFANKHGPSPSKKRKSYQGKKESPVKPKTNTSPAKGK